MTGNKEGVPLSELDRLTLAEQSARSDYQKVNAEFEMRLRDMVSAAKQRIEEELNLIYCDKIKAAREAYKAAQAAVTAEQDRLARAPENPPHPIGTKMVQWKRPKSWHMQLQKTGKLGVFECINKDSKHPSNLRYYSRARIGSFVVRILKKDGGPGLMYDMYRSYCGWYPEGVDPNREDTT